MNENKDIDEIISDAERIGVIGSPSSTSQLELDILAPAVEKDLIGSFVFFRYKQNGNDHIALGQINEIQLKNIWTEDATVKGLIREKGEVDPITERQDTHSANMTIGAVFSKNDDGSFEESSLGTVPSTGTTVFLVNNELLEKLLHPLENELFNIGYIYGSDDILMPTWFRHFGAVEENGAGEAYHFGIFGKTGSGKSYLARMILSCYSTHDQMSIFVIDPQGEFSNDEEFKKILGTKLSRTCDVVNLHNLVLNPGSSWRLFKEILMSSDFLNEYWGIRHEDNQRQAANYIVRILRDEINYQAGINHQNGGVEPWNIYERDAFDRVRLGILNTESIQENIYTSETPRNRMINELQNNVEQAYSRWESVCNLFSYHNKEDGESIENLVEEIVMPDNENKITMINLSETDIPENTYWNENIRFIIIREFIKELKEKAEEAYKEDESLNTLVCIDEAHRLAPRRIKDNEVRNAVKSSLKDSVRTTRKYGLGWMFISQTLSSLDTSILRQLRTYIFGFGLGWGTELDALRNIVGGDKEIVDLYQSLKDPHSSIGEKEYPFMSFGPISPLSFSGRPLFFKALKFPDEFVEELD